MVKDLKRRKSALNRQGIIPFFPIPPTSSKATNNETNIFDLPRFYLVAWLPSCLIA
jgi:hypothetical protein